MAFTIILNLPVGFPEELTSEAGLVRTARRRLALATAIHGENPDAEGIRVLLEDAKEMLLAAEEIERGGTVEIDEECDAFSETGLRNQADIVWRGVEVLGENAEAVDLDALLEISFSLVTSLGSSSSDQQRTHPADDEEPLEDVEVAQRVPKGAAV